MNSESELEVSMGRSSARATVVVVYEDPVVGQTLALLLQTTNYSVRLIAQSSLRDPEQSSGLLEGVRVLLLASGLSAERHDTILTLLKSRPATADIPVLELGVPPEGAQVEADYSVPWPSRTEELKLRIKRALSTEEDEGREPRTEEDGA